MTETKLTVEVLWHNEFDGFNKTTLDAPSVPSMSEAAQLIAVVEDEDVTQLTVDSIREVSK